MKNFIITLSVMLAVLCCPTLLSAQNITVRGRVTDSSSGEPLMGALVSAGSTKGVITDVEGRFEMSVAPTTAIQVTYIGFKKAEFKASAGESLEVKLESDATALNEVVVVGYGTQKLKDLTAPIATVKGDELSKQISANPMSALQGMVSGVQITQSGEPGAGPSVKIRGVGSIGDYASPLYVVDGVLLDNIDFLSSSDIESLSVLKDASAAAIYGVRAANGVVLVTTRKGSVGTTTISYEGYAGVQVPTNIMKLANKAQYVELMNQANANTTGYNPISASQYPGDIDWYNALVRPALTHNHSVDVSGANDRTNFSLGLNYYYQDGIISKSDNDYQRLNFRFRVDQKVRKWLNIGASSVLSIYEKNAANTSAFSQAYVNPPVYNIYNDLNTEAYPVKFDSPQLYGFGNSYGNPVAAAYYYDNNERGIKDVFSTYLDFIILPEKLTFKTSYNLEFAFWNQNNYTPESYVGGSQGNKNSQLSKTFGYSVSQIIDNVLTYSDRIDNHNFSVMVGQSTRMYYSPWLTGRVQNVSDYDDASKYLTTGSASNRYANDGASRYNGLSAFARATYNYADRYLATFTFRADGSSKYQQKWGYFPSIGLGWNITRENFMQSQNAFQNLKLRASWGMLGNDYIPSNSAITVGTTGIGSSGAFGETVVDGQGSQTVYQNSLIWETVSEFNVGLDFATLGSRLTGEIDYYNRTTSNVVFYVPIATGGGTAELLDNNGRVRNQGVELGLNWKDRAGKDFIYNVGINLTTIDNKVIEMNGRDYLPGAMVRGNYSTRTQVGYPIGSFWGYEIDGVYATEGEALTDPVTQTIKGAGFFKYKNQNGDNTIDENDKTYLGSPIPKLIMGLNFGFTCKGFDFSLLLNAQVGNKILNAKRMNRDVYSDGNYDADFYNNCWMPNRKSSTYPSAEAYNAGYTQQANSFFVEDGSYLRIQNVQLGYTFDKIKGMKSIRIYASAQRPLTIFGYNGFTPEISGSPISSGVDNSVYPMQSIYTIGLNLKF